jgi:hypothetical protein
LALDQFRSVVVLLLLGASVVAALLGDALEAIAILVALVLNAAIGFNIRLIWAGSTTGSAPSVERVVYVQSRLAA